MSLNWLRVHCLLAYAVMGAWMPYLSLYLENELALTRSQIGWVLSQMGVAVIVAPPIFAMLADRWFSSRTLIGGIYAMGAAALALLSQVDSFAGALLAFGLYCFCYVAMIPLLNALIMQVIEKPESGGTGFHRVRVWGTVGFILPSVGLFLALRMPQVSSQAAIYTAAGAALLGALMTTRLPAGEVEAPLGGRGIPTFAALKTARQRPVAMLLLAVFLLVAGAVSISTLYPLYLKELGVDEQWVGAIFNIGVLIEAGCMLSVGWFNRRIGLRGLLIVGFGAAVLRFALLASVPSVATAILTQLLHGPMIVAMAVAPVIYLNHKAGVDHRNSIQGLLAMLCMGLGRLIGANLAGSIADAGAALGSTLGGIQLAYAVVTGLVGLGTLCLIFGFRDDAATEHLKTAPA
jgi:PPP family 3-phenylpropionic acid transporter